MPRIVITGSNRGLGLEWARQYAAAGWQVVASCRRPECADELNALAAAQPKVSVARLDVTDAVQVEELARELRGEAIDLLVNNAGVYFERWDRDPLGAIDYGDWEMSLRVNTLGPVRLTEALVEHLDRAPRPLVLATTSHMGSIADITRGRSYAYRSSKAALNAAMKGLAEELRPRGIGVLLLHPGWVRTRMGGPDAPYSPEQSVRGMRELAERFTLEQSGHFLRFDGTAMPW